LPPLGGRTVTFGVLGVECKSGDNWGAILEALPQALTYRFIFDEVYIATSKFNNLDRVKPSQIPRHRVHRG